MTQRSSNGETQAKSPNKDALDKLMFSYTSDTSYLEEENKVLKQTLEHLKKELQKYQQNPLLVAEIKESVKKGALIKLNNGNEFFVNIAPDCEKIEPGDSVLVEQKNLTVLRKIPVVKKFNVEQFVIVEKPKMSWKDVGGLDEQAREIQEVVELPLLKPNRTYHLYN